MLQFVQKATMKCQVSVSYCCFALHDWHVRSHPQVKLSIDRFDHEVF